MSNAPFAYNKGGNIVSRPAPLEKGLGKRVGGVSEFVVVDQFELDAVRRENQLNDGFNVPLADVDAVVANVEMVDDYDVREVADTSEPDREDYGRFAVNLIVPPRRSVTRDKHGKATVTIHYPANRPEYEGW